jgi:hypothetical protein
VLEISARKPAWLGKKAKDPFQSISHHPAWSLRLGTGEKVKCRTDAEHHCGNTIPVRDYPGLLLWTPKPHEEPARSGISNLLDDALVFLGAKRPKWRRHSEYNPNSWILLFNFA